MFIKSPSLTSVGCRGAKWCPESLALWAEDVHGAPGYRDLGAASQGWA